MADLRIPLFPLNVVLFPGMELPLRVFEERYQVMLAECLAPEAIAQVQEVVPSERHATPPGLGYFGVCLTEDPEVGVTARPATVGTLARLIEVSPPDGERELLCVGVCRFRVEKLHERRPFLEADITFLEEPEPGEDAQAEAREALVAFEKYVEAMVVAAEPDVGKALLSLAPRILTAPVGEACDRIAEALLVPPDQKQVVLEAETPFQRLRLVRRILIREVRRSRLLLLSRNAHLN